MQEEYYEIVKDILNNKEFLKRKNFAHHDTISVYEHSLKVSKKAYNMSKRFKKIDRESIAIGGLLHDFYTNPWQDNKEKKPLFKKHGFTHAHEALENARKYFPNYMNERVENIIERHMFPLNIRPPKYKEAWLVSLADKLVSIEVFKNPNFILRLIGIRGKKNE